MFPLRLHAKFLVLVLGSLTLFLGTISVYLIHREARLLERKAEEKQHILAFAIYSDLKESMIEETPRSTLRLMESLRGKYDLVRLEVLRKDGTPAFGVPGAPVVLPQLAESFESGKQLSFHQDKGQPVHTILYPLKNEPVCSSCHRDGQPVLGVLLTCLSWKDSLREISASRRTLTLFFTALILSTGTVLYVLVRRLVLQPLAALHDGAERIGRGQLNHRITLDTKDEMQDLAQTLNSMGGSLEESYAGLEQKVKERTAEVEDKAKRLYEYSRDMATISRLSTKVFDAEQNLDEMLDRFQWAVTRGLGYRQSVLCLIDRKQALLEVKRDSGLAEPLGLISQSLHGSDPFAELVRSGKELLVQDAFADPLFGRVHKNSAALISLAVMPIRTNVQHRRCWEMKSCVRADCPAFQRAEEPCWLLSGTCCGNSLMESYGDKLAYCMTCEVFPVLGVLIVAGRSSHSFRRRDLNVLRILASEMGAALENHILHEDNRQLVRDLLKLHNVTAAAMVDLSLGAALEAFTDSAMKFSGLDACNFWLLSEDGQELVRNAGSGHEQPDAGSYPSRLPLDRGIVGRAFSTNKVVAEYNLPENDATELGTCASGREVRGVLALPLQTRDQPLGVLSVHKRGTTPFLEREVVAFMLLANHAAMAMNVCTLNAELKSQNRELAATISLMRGILASMSSGVLLLGPDGTIRLINEAGAELLHMRPEDMMDRSMAELFPDAGAFLTTSTGLYQEVDIMRRSNTVITLGFSAARYSGQPDGEEGTIVVYRDLTEIKSLQAAVLTKERFEAMGQVVAGVAHEIRNPLFGISSIGQIFERELTEAGHLELVRALLSETKRLNELVEELLIYGRPAKLMLAECDLTALWREVTEMHRAELDQKDITLAAELDRAQTKAHVDGHQIRQVFLNLFRNAVDATTPGGSIAIRLLLEDRNIIFSISDSGEGIPEHQLAKVFDLFYTTKSKGTGMGLAICRKIVEDHGGQISLASRVQDGPDRSRGTTVTVKIPYRVAVQVPPAL
jgi:nitrogen fixation/metabolism regulation signal transduction histidine kinase